MHNSLGTLTLGVFAQSSAIAVDHNNVDANRPLSFDDAESIGLREQSLEVGVAVTKPSGSKVGGELELEYLYGFAPNTHLNIGIEPSVGGRAGTDDNRFDPGNVSVGVFHNFNSEYNIALRAYIRTVFKSGIYTFSYRFKFRQSLFHPIF
jgi:hypothetical protein